MLLSVALLLLMQGDSVATARATQPDGVRSFVSHGPFGGPISALALDPAHSGTAYAATGTRLYKTTDGGLQWTLVFDRDDPFGGIGSVLVVPGHPGSVYMAASFVSRPAVLRSTDGGQTWTYGDTSGIDQDSHINELVADPSDRQTLYVATGSFGGVYKTTDSGSSWFPANDGLQYDTTVFALALDPTDPSTLYAGGENGLFKTTDGGMHWRPLSLSVVIRALAINPMRTNVVYAVARQPDGATVVYKSRRGGETWRLLQQFPELGSDFGEEGSTIAVNPLHPGILYVGTIQPLGMTSRTLHPGVLKSTDGGRTWAPANAGLTNRFVLDLAIDQQRPSALLIGTAAGVFASRTSGSSWRSSNEGLIGTRVNAIAVDQQRPSVVYAGTSGTGGQLFKSRDGGATWNRLVNGLPRSGSVTALAIDPSDHARLLAVIDGRLYESLDAGRTWIRRGSAYDVRKIVIDPLHDLLYAIQGFYGSLIKSADGGLHWDVLDPRLAPAQYVRDIAIVPEHPGTLYAATDAGLFVTRDRGQSWTRFDGADAPSQASAVAVDPIDRRIVTVAGSDTIWQTDDGGSHWRASSFFFDVVDFSSVAIDPTNDQVLFAGTSWYFAEGGLWTSEDGGASWHEAPDVPAGINAIVVGSDSRAHVATVRGVFDG